jgi:tRNA pseudouridine55 synthase
VPDVSAPQDPSDPSGFGRGGVLVIDKPPGPTSHDIVAVVRRRCRGLKVGHTGTLDPFATGVLPLVVGQATRLARYLGGDEKEYRAVIRLGRATDTHDETGQVVFEAPAGARMPGEDELTALLSTFLGTWAQTPPAFSAKLSDGVRAYDEARRGRPVSLAPVQVTVSDIELLGMEGPLATVRMATSAGFYVRAFAHEIGLRLGVGACLSSLRRTRSGGFRIEDAVSLAAVVEPGLERHLVRLEALLPDFPSVVLTAEGVDRAGHGRELGPLHYSGQRPERPAGSGGTPVRLLGPDGRLLALGEMAAGGILHPVVVLG